MVVNQKIEDFRAKTKYLPISDKEGVENNLDTELISKLFLCYCFVKSKDGYIFSI